MQKIPCIKFFPLLLLFLCCFVVQPASAAHTITDQEWQQLTNDKAFDYKNEKEMAQENTPNAPQNFFSRLIGALFFFFTSTAGRTILWVLVAFFVGYLVYKGFLADRQALFKREKKVVEEQGTKEVIEEINDHDWELQLRNAIKEGNYKLAIRSSYLFILQLLNERQAIQYRADKTNYDYYYELRDTAYKLPFKQLTRQYEFAWYGDYPIAEDGFREYMCVFESLKSKIR
jgi:hypothetical protein